MAQIILGAPAIQNTTPTRRHFDGIQALRALAAISVLLFHLYRVSQDYFTNGDTYKIFSRGYIGVQLFFVISGFIITFIHWEDIGNKLTLKRYVNKRLFRILPLSTLAISVVFIYFIAAQATRTSWPSAIGHPEPYSYIDFLQNVLLIGPNHILGTTWTLTYEMFFYAWFAVSLVLGRKWILGSGVIWLCLIAAARIKHFEPSNYFLSIVFDSRCAMFLIGVAIAWITRTRTFTFAGWPLTLVGSIMFFGIWLLPQGDSGWRYTALELGGCGLMVFGAALPWNFNIPKPITFLGDASYSIYLTHHILILAFAWIITRSIGELTRPLPAIGFALGAVVILLLTLPVYLWLEKPLTQWAQLKFKPAKA